MFNEHNFLNRTRIAIEICHYQKERLATRRATSRLFNRHWFNYRWAFRSWLFIGGLSNDPSPAPNVHSYPRCIISRSRWFTAPTWRVQAAALFLPGDNRVRSRFIYPCPMHLMGRRGDKEAGFVQLNVRRKDTGPRSSVLKHPFISITHPFNPFSSPD